MYSSTSALIYYIWCVLVHHGSCRIWQDFLKRSAHYKASTYNWDEHELQTDLHLRLEQHSSLKFSIWMFQDCTVILQISLRKSEPLKLSVDRKQLHKREEIQIWNDNSRHNIECHFSQKKEQSIQNSEVHNYNRY